MNKNTTTIGEIKKYILAQKNQGAEWENSKENTLINFRYSKYYQFFSEITWLFVY